MGVFFEALFVRDAYATTADAWRDISTDEHFIFESSFGVFRLRKRQTYPATYAYVEGATLYAGYGDTTLGNVVTNNALTQLPEEAFYDDEFLHLRADCHTQTVTVQRDAFCTLPIFTLRQQDKFVMSNHYEVIWQLANQQTVHVDTLATLRWLMQQDPRGHSFFKEIEAMHDRARLIWADGMYTATQAPDSNIARVMADRAGDPRHFRRLLEERLAFYWDRYTAGTLAGSELSMGVDSTLINGYFADQGHMLYPATISYPGTFGESQQRKLTDFTTRFGVQSQTFVLDPTTDYPLASKIHDGAWQPFFFGYELYRQSFQKIATYLAAKGVGVVFRGSGGDELCENLPDLLRSPKLILQEQAQAAPAQFPWIRPAASAMASQVVNSLPDQPTLSLTSPGYATGPLDAANTYLEQNIWPVQPFNDPRLYAYCQSLPIEYRWDKKIMRAYMHARHFPQSIYEAEVNEHFGPFFDHVTATQLAKPFEQLMEHSVLAKAGLIDARKAMDCWHQTMAEPDSDWTFALYTLLTIEANLQLANQLSWPTVLSTTTTDTTML